MAELVQGGANRGFSLDRLSLIVVATGAAVAAGLAAFAFLRREDAWPDTGIQPSPILELDPYHDALRRSVPPADRRSA